jgi:hypothetical protein
MVMVRVKLFPKTEEQVKLDYNHQEITVPTVTLIYEYDF